MSDLIEIELNKVIEKKIFALNENVGNISPPNDVSSENTKKTDKTKKSMKTVDDKVKFSDDESVDEILLCHSLHKKQDCNDKEPQEKVLKDNDDLSSRDEIDAEQCISKGKY